MQKNIAFATWEFCVPEKAKLNVKLRFIMRVSVFCFTIMLFTIQLWATNTRAQTTINDKRINFTAKDETLKKALKDLEIASGFRLFYPSEKIKSYMAGPVDNNTRTVAEILNMLLANTSLRYKQEDNRIILFEEVTEAKIVAIPKLFLGSVVDEKDEPLAGVTIKVKTSLVSIASDSKGKFNIVVEDPKAILVFSYIGFLTQEIPVSDLKNPLKIKMREDMSKLDEVQVMAYSNTTKRLNTSNTVTITAEVLERNPVPNVLQALQGRVPGMFIQQQSGQPGTPFDIKVRGTNTISAGSKGGQPLIVVDGVAYPSSNLPQLANLNIVGNFPTPLQGGSGLDYLNPQMIERIDVLKDIDATAIYGSRGAYGVILITTKKGTAGDPKLNVNSYTGVTLKGQLPEMLNTDEYLTIRREAFKNDGLTPGPADLDLNGAYPTDRYTDLGKQYNGQSAISTNTMLTYSGGNTVTNYLIGGSYSNQQNTQITGGQNQSGVLNFSVNTGTKDQKFTLGLSGSYSSNVNTISPLDNTKSIITLAPNTPDLILPDGTLNWADYSTNPAANIYQIFRNQVNNLISNINLTYRPVQGLTLRTTFGFNDQSGKNLTAQPSTFFKPGTAFKTLSNLDIYSTQTWTLEPNASYVHQLGSKGNLTLTAGGTVQSIQISSDITNGSDFISDALLTNPTFTNAANITTTYNKIPRRYLGYFGLINYNWADKYILNISGRYDGSSKFGSNNQYGSFGSLGGAWIVSEEPWFKQVLPFVSFAKIHGSYGTVGGDAIPDYQYANIFVSTNGYQGNVGLSPNNLANPYIQWEKNTKSEIGFNLDFFKGRISLEGSYYTNKTSNQLVNLPLSQTTGFAGITTNLPAVVKNTGYELVLNTKNINSKQFSWSTSFNITLPKSILESYPGLNTTNSSTYTIGKSVSGIRVYNYAGVNPQTGLYNYINAAGVQSDFPIFGPGTTLDAVADKTVFIDLSPKYYGGFNNSFRYGNFSLDVLFSFTSRWGANYANNFTTPPGQGLSNYPKIALTRWQKPGDVTNIPKATTSVFALFAQSQFNNSSGAYSDYTYARLNNANLSYQVPNTLAKKLHLTDLRFYIQGQNLLTIAKNSGGFDPENFGVGVPPLRVFIAGINLTL